jgi:hypothetical protein
VRKYRVMHGDAVRPQVLLLYEALRLSGRCSILSFGNPVIWQCSRLL